MQVNFKNKNFGFKKLLQFSTIIDNPAKIRYNNNEALLISSYITDLNASKYREHTYTVAALFPPAPKGGGSLWKH